MTDESFEQDRSFLADGNSMTSMCNPAGTPERHKRYPTDDVIPPGTYFAPAPVQMVIFGRTPLVIEGLSMGGERSVAAVGTRTDSTRRRGSPHGSGRSSTCSPTSTPTWRSRRGWT